MKPNFALDLSHEGINLLHRSKGGWTLVGSVALDDPAMGTRLEELRRSAAMLESGGFTTKLIIPDSQVLYTTLDAPGPDDIAREVQIRAGLDGLTPYPVGELVFDWRGEGDQVRVAVLARETMDEAESFAVQHKFNPVSIVARPTRGAFSGEPFFGKTRASARILPPGERIEPDASPVPKNPRAKELPEAARVDLPEETPAGDVDPTPAAEPAPAQAPKLQSTVHDEADDAFAELDRLAAELSGEGAAAAATETAAAPKPASKPRRKRKTDAPSVAPPPLAPFPPTPDETSDAPMPTPRPFMPKPEKVDPPKPAKPAAARGATETSPGAPVPPAPAPITAPAEPAPNGTPPPDMPQASEAPEAPAVSFTSTRAPAGDDATGATEPDGTRLAGMAPRIDVGGEAQTSAAPVPPAPATEETPAAGPRVTLPPVASPHDPLRAGMAEALAKPLPRPGDAVEPEEKAPGVFARATGAARSALATRAEQRAARKAEAAEAALAKPTPSKAAPAEAEPQGKGRFGSRPSRKPPEKKRDPQAEALTVFGARKTQVTRDRPKYLGLVLTLLLLLLMAAAALWSGFLIDDGETSLFNPGPDTTVESPAAATDSADAGATPPAQPATAEVLSPEAAEARYAATGIWQRAPEVPAEPETTRLTALDITALAPAIAGRDATPLPDGSSGASGDAALADPVPPPPPGTTFDLDANGLVVPTPEGALSPTGILVYSGPPATVPPTPPEGLLPAPAPDPAPDTAEPDTDAAVTDDAVDAAVDAAIAAVETAPAALPGVPAIRPAARPAEVPPIPAPAETDATTDTPDATATGDDATAPDDNAALIAPEARPVTPPVTDTAAIDAAIDDVIAAALVNPTELAVPASIVPSQRPGNFDKIVTAARAGASDGSQVIAAAMVTPAIPTAANVAAQATTENALNLRKVNLIGIYGSSSARRALVRLDNGRYVKVEVGDRLDGGKVTSISASKLTYQKGSRAYTLEVLPLG